MIEKIKYSTISTIYVKELIYYDENKEEHLKDFCTRNGITFLPNKNKQSCYKLVNNTFIETPLTNELICKPYDRIFDKTTLEKFEKNNQDEVMFVVEEDKIKGVVHIVDYNTEFLYFEFYKAAFFFEKNLRRLLISKKETNKSLLSWMKEKATKNGHWEKRYLECNPEDEAKKNKLYLKRRDCSPFQTFYLNDLLFFAASKRYISKEFRKSLEAIRDIRNWVSHNKDLTHKSELDNNPLYKIEELKDFVNNANIFFKCYEELEDLTIKK